MKNWLLGLLVLVAIVSGIGVYRGWFTVDKQKIEQDEKAVEKVVHDLEKKVEDKAADWNKPAASPK